MNDGTTKESAVVIESSSSSDEDGGIRLKRLRTDNSFGFSIVDHFPREICLRIFLSIDPYDLYRRCAFVSKSWHQVITSSEACFIHLLKAEFCEEDVTEFLSTPGALPKFHQLARESKGAFSRKGLEIVFDCDQVYNRWRQHLMEKRNILSPSLGSVHHQMWSQGIGRLLLGRYGDSSLLNDLPYSFHRNSLANDPSQELTVFCLEKVVPGMVVEVKFQKFPKISKLRNFILLDF